MAGPFKMKGSPMQRNFGIGSPTRKISSYAEAKKKDPNLDAYIAERKKHDAGSAEYEAAQSKINVAYGAKRSETLKAAQIKKVETKKADTRAKEQAADVKMQKDLDAGFAKAEKGISEQKAFLKEEVASTTKKDLRKAKRAKIKATRAQAKSLRGTEGITGLSRKDIREAKKASIKATREKYKTAKKTLKTLKKTTKDY